jgi:hypothetical protein
MFNGLHVKYTLFVPEFNETENFSTDFRKMLKYQISWKSVQLEVSSMRKDGWIMTKLIVAFRNCAGAPKKWNNHWQCRQES